eukprot:g4643.t1
MMVQQKKTGMTFKQLDSTISKYDRRGNVNQTETVKTTKMNELVPHLMGISKPVLESVIFVHQDESNWPLGDPKQLKTKLDDIFATTRYNKALKEIADQKKAKNRDAKDVEGTLKEAGAHLQQANRLRRNLKDMKATLEEKRAEIQENEEEREALAKRRNELQAKMERVQGSIREMETAEHILQEKQRHLEDMGAKLPQDSPEMEDMSIDDLKEAISELNSGEGADETMLKSVQKKKRAKEAEIESMRQDQERLSRDLGKLEAEALSKKKQQALLEDAVADAIKSYSDLAPLQANLGQQSAEDEGWASIVSATRAIAEREKTALKEVQESRRREFEELTKAKGAVDGKIGAVQLQMKEKKGEVEKNEKETKVIQESVSSAAEGAMSLKRTAARLKTRLDAAQRAVDSHVEGGDSDPLVKLANERVALRQQVDIAKDELDAARDQLDVVTRNASVMARIASKRDELEREEEEEKRITDEVSLSYKKAFAGDGRSDGPTAALLIPDMDAMEGPAKVEAVSAKCLALKMLLKTNKESLQKRLSARSAAEHELASKEKQVKRLSADHAARLESAFECYTSGRSVQCFQDDDEDSAIRTASDLNSASAKSAVKVLEQYKLGVDKEKQLSSAMITIISDAKKNLNEAGVCSMCKRGFHGHNEEEKFRTQLSTMLATFEAGGAKDVEHQNAVDALEAMKKCVHILEEADKVQQQLMQAKAEEGPLRAAFQEAQQQAEMMERDIAVLEAKRSSIDGIERTLVQLQQVTKRVHMLRTHLTQDEASMPGRGGQLASMTLDGARSLQQERENALDALRLQIERVEQKRENLRRERQKEKEALQEARDLYQRHMEKSRAVEDNRVKLQQLMERQKLLGEQLEACHASLEPLKAERAKLLADTTAKEAHWKAEEVVASRRSEEASRHAEKLARLVSEVSTRSSVAERMRVAREAVQDRAAKREAAVQALEAIKAELKELDLAVNQKDVKRQRIEAFISFKEAQREILEKKKELVERRKALRSENVEEAQREWAKLNKTIDGLSARNQKHSGATAELERQLRDIDAQLLGPEYDAIDDRHKRLQISHSTLLMAVKDMEKFGKALDAALHTFHETRISEINACIEELWRLCYQGGDIDTIQLRAEARKEKSYNYNLVMRKADQFIPMRGRCSAGQKVLASIVVRLALAETFCINCGLLALDEPTTNLDDVDKSGLVAAIAKIIENRKQQRNFQLIIITHDEEFLRELAIAIGENKPEKFFRVSRKMIDQDRGYYTSEITEEDFGAL